MTSTRREAGLLIGGLGLALAGGARGWAKAASPTPAPADGLPRSNTQDIDPDAVLAFLDDTAASGFELNSFMLWRSGAVAAEGWWWPYRADLPHMLHSAAKSFTGTGIGVAVGEGLIKLDDPVLKFFPGRVANPSANLQAMTVESLLTQTSGHAAGISGSAWRPLSTSWVDEFFKVPVVYRPGEHFAYSSATSFMLSAIINQVTGASLHAYMRPRVFAPLGVQDARWDVGPENINPGGNGLSVTTADFLKLGLLHLNGGKWAGRQVLPAAWVAAVGRPQHGNDYSYQWWLMPNDLGYFAAGKFGQFCYVFPKLDAILVVTAGVADNEATREAMHGLAYKHIAALCGEAGARRTAAQARLDTRAAGLRALPPLRPAASPQAARISGHTVACAPNADGVISLKVTFQDGAADFEMTDNRGTHRVRNGLIDWVESDTTITGGYLHHEYEPAQKRVVAGGRWIAPDRFQMVWQFVESGFRDTAMLTVDGDTVRYDRGVNVNSGPLQRPTITGRTA